MNKEIVILGAGGHGKVVADIARLNGYSDIIFLDDNKETKFCGDQRVSGTIADFVKYKEKDFAVAIGNSQAREFLFDKLISVGVKFATLIHPSAVVASDVKIGKGTVVMAGSVINPGTSIGAGCIINTMSSVDHDCVVSDYAHISVGTHLAGNVSVGSHSWLGIGAVVSNNVNICSSCVIGAGAVVISDINESGTYVGVPARRIK